MASLLNKAYNVIVGAKPDTQAQAEQGVLIQQQEKQQQAQAPKPEPVISQSGRTEGMRYLGGDYYGNPTTGTTYDTSTKTYSSNYDWLVNRLKETGRYVEAGQTLTPTQAVAQVQAQKAVNIENFAQEQTALKGGFAGREAQARTSGMPSFTPVVGVGAAKASELSAAFTSKLATTPGQVGYHATQSNPAGLGYTTISQNKEGFIYQSARPTLATQIAQSGIAANILGVRGGYSNINPMLKTSIAPNANITYKDIQKNGVTMSLNARATPLSLTETQMNAYSRVNPTRDFITQGATSRQALISSGVDVSRIPKPVSFIANQTDVGSKADYSVIRQGGFMKSWAAITSSTAIVSKLGETTLRGVGKNAGSESGYSKSTQELMHMIAQRERERPSLLNIAMQSPVTAAIPVGAGFKIGSVLARTSLIESGSLIGKALPKIGGLVSKSNLLVEPLATVGGIGYVGLDIAQSKDIYQAGGKLTGYAASTPGAIIGYNKAGTLTSYIGTLGKPTVPVTSIIKTDVLSGKETFPTTTAGSFGKFKQEFKTPEGTLAGYHSTPEAFNPKGFDVIGKTDIQMVKEHALMDVPGLYISPYMQGASKHFLRLSGESSFIASLKSFKTSSAMKPEINLIRGITDIQRIPGGQNVAGSRHFLRSGYGGQTGIPRAGTDVFIEPKMEIGGFRGEAQAVIAPGTKVGAISKAYRTKVSDQFVRVSERYIQPSDIQTAVETPSPKTLKTGGYGGFRERQYYEPAPFRAVPLSYGVLSKSSSAVNKSTSSILSSRNVLSSGMPASRYNTPSSAYSSISKSISRSTPQSSISSKISSKASSTMSSMTSSVASRISSPVSSMTSAPSSISSPISSRQTSSSRPYSSVQSTYETPKLYSSDSSYVPGSLIKRKKGRKGKTRVYVTSLSGKTASQMMVMTKGLKSKARIKAKRKK